MAGLGPEFTFFLVYLCDRLSAMPCLCRKIPTDASRFLMVRLSNPASIIVKAFCMVTAAPPQEREMHGAEPWLRDLGIAQRGHGEDGENE